MTRVDVHYGGFVYTIPDSTRETVKEQIDTALREGAVVWLEVNYGSGSRLRTDLLITPGTPIGLAEIDDPDEA